MLRSISPVRSAMRTMATSSQSASKVPLLVTPKELHAMPQSTTRILDVSWHMPASPRNPTEEYLAGPRIPHAHRWDLDQIAEASEGLGGPKGLGHMMPSGERFAEACAARGIRKDDHVVLYDTVGIFSAPRGWFTFKAMGHEKVSVLDGGMPRYLAELLGEGAERGPPEATIEKSEYPVPKTKDAVRSWEHMMSNLDKGASSDADIVLDARSYDRWTGSAPEPRPSLSSGHMPHSLSLPFNTLLDPPSPPQKTWTTYLPPSGLREAVLTALAGRPSGSWGELSDEEKKRAGELWDKVKSGERDVTWTCGSGMTACVGVLGMRILAEAEGGVDLLPRIYDESWTGYAMRPESKIVEGEK